VLDWSDTGECHDYTGVHRTSGRVYKIAYGEPKPSGVGDLAKLCAVSGVSARIAAASVPLSGAARVAITRQPHLFETALTGGDDYEVLCTVPETAWPAFQTAAAAASVSVTAVGVIEEGTHAPVIEGEGGRPLAFGRTSFSHF